MDIQKLLSHAILSHASDIHLNIDICPVMRVDGELKILNNEELVTAQTLRDLFESITNEKQKQTVQTKKQVNFSYVIPNVGRFRVNILLQRGALSFAFRVITPEIVSFSSMGLPEIYAEITAEQKGLILITGPTGCGKSSTLAAMVDFINENDTRHIITIEDPIEYQHFNKKSIISQLEVGKDTDSFGQALSNTLRHDPDVLVVGEMRDIEAIGAAITAAETGHLVLGTMNTNDAIQTVDRIIDTFPEAQQAQRRIQLSQVLLGIFSQVLLPCIDGGRVPAYEIMIANSVVRTGIREGKSQNLQNAMHLGIKEKMQTLNQSLAKLVIEKKVTIKQAMYNSLDKEQLMNLIGLKTLAQKPLYP